MSKVTPLDLNQFLPYRLAQLSQLVSQDFALLYQASEQLSVAQWRILANLAVEADLSAQHLCERAQLDKSKVSRALRELLERGLVARVRDAQDSRANRHCLSEEGWQVYAKIAKRAKAWEKQRLSGLSEQEQQDLLELLNKVQLGVENSHGSL
ncbi:MarR family winged helix-turn-helix transcriptional regulator [Paraferrimonas sedimenticola]|uniref:MarR family transcriptional regulator n=1 Tax=Paraferrimonas sedimenticola TaxID=375674 RepID=A0AA37RXY1_9GAMM|nr:MarR family winged helix-turn-helix transcriptional regulator [Paraferrimonas sedimenticola]GLP97566.1 MarR family transcriptional regulator [Paraferrimonas sedimenticola]